MAKTIGYALLVDINVGPGPIEDGVYIFKTKEEATEFAVRQLDKVGFDLSVCSNPEEALEEYQSSLSGMDYYHIREQKAVPQVANVE